MARVLLAWELGAGYGHMAPFRVIALRLKEQGHVPALVVKLLTNAAEYFGHDLCDVWQAPMADRPLKNPVKTQVSYASILHNTGFGDPEGLAARINAWRVLLRSHRADALMCHHTPTAAVAAQVLDIPVWYIGSGFMVPPLLSPFPSFRVDAQIPEAVLRQNETHVLGSLNRALEILGVDPFDDLQGVYRGGRPAMLTYPALDHYDVERPETSLGLPDFSYGQAPVWPTGDGPRVFAYLRPTPTSSRCSRASATVGPGFCCGSRRCPGTSSPPTSAPAWRWSKGR